MPAQQQPLQPPRPRGRPRSFDRGAALAKAAKVFWRLGYEGASIAELTAAMGITAQSLYSAFSSKADLYREALDWYRAEVGSDTTAALGDPDAVTALTRVLRGSAETFARDNQPHGCMVSTAVLACAPEHAPIARHVADLRGATLDAIAARIGRGIAEGQLRPSTDPQSLARFVGAMIQGMSVQARDGASETELAALADHAIAQIAANRA